jgi:serpin B
MAKVQAEESISNIVNGNNQFALNLFSQISSFRQGNNFISPWSIYSAMAIASEGALGRTTLEMQQTLHLPENDSLRRKSFALAYDRFNAKDSGYALSVANALWVEKDYPLLVNFASDVERYYHATAKNMDFKRASEDARETINSWVEEKTNGTIKELIQPGDIIPETSLIITNAVYFKGIWIRSFNKNLTRKGSFKTLDGRTVETPMMASYGKESRFNYLETGNMQMLELPYRGNTISMIILLPKDNSTSSLEKSLSLERLDKWKKDSKDCEVVVYIPKFTFATRYHLCNYLEDMGMTLIFTPEADFSGIAGSKGPFMSDVIHQAFVDVNEEGTEASAATATVLRGVTQDSPRMPIFNADHPFIFIIQDVENGSILFMGRVSDPSNVS